MRIEGKKHGKVAQFYSTSHRRCEHGDGGGGGGGSSKFDGGLKLIHERSMRGLKMLSKNTCGGVHLIVKLCWL